MHGMKGIELLYEIYFPHSSDKRQYYESEIEKQFYLSLEDAQVGCDEMNKKELQWKENREAKKKIQ